MCDVEGGVARGRGNTGPRKKKKEMDENCI